MKTVKLAAAQMTHRAAALRSITLSKYESATIKN